MADREILSPAMIKHLQHGLDRIAALDAMVEWIARDVEREVSTWGEGIRHLFGRNRLFPAPADEDLGRIVADGLVAWALAERAAIAQRIGHLVEVRDPPAVGRFFGKACHDVE